MHEYALYSQVDATRHDQVLQILAGLTAMQPVPICEQTLIYQQLKTDAATSKKGAPKQQHPQQQAKGLGYHKLVRTVNLVGDEASFGPFRLRIEETPQAGVPSMISRPVVERELTERELERFRGKSEWYRYTTQYLAFGSRFIHSSATIVRLTRLMTVPEGTGALEPLDAPIPLLHECQLFDASGGWLVEVCVRIEDGNNSKLAEQAVNQLLSFKRQVDGALDLRVPERLALDTRVKDTRVKV